MSDVRPADQEARDLIATSLDTCYLVEAGAGSGKTTALVGRMLALVAAGTAVERIAAVTFTRKAANELRERFQLRLERAVRDSVPGTEAHARFERALRDLDRAYLGTIHSFCGRLLRERPLEVGLDPNFEEVTDADWDELRRSFWRRWLDERRRTDDARIVALASVAIDPRQVEDTFEKLVAFPDVEFPVSDTPRPDIRACRRELEDALADAWTHMPEREPEKGWDGLMSLVRRLYQHRRIHGWDHVASFCDALAMITPSGCKATYNRWPVGREEVKALEARLAAFLAGIGGATLRQWHEHRYPIVIGFARAAARDFERQRHQTGRLSFEDLLLLSARLLRENPAVRDELGARYAHLLVDEFQDTDPVQAEVCLLLASPAHEGNDWRTVTPRPGSLFVVGDPKQSIYRFRRADIQVYDLVKSRFATFGRVLTLVQNFRSTRPIEALVNARFAELFPPASTPEQAAYVEMRTKGEDAGGVSRYVVTVGNRVRPEELFARDSAVVASLVAERIARREATAGDFLVLTARKDEIALYARALAERNVAVTTTGAKLPQERELTELLVVLRAIADPENPVLVAAALEGLFFGLSPAQLFAARQAGLRFAIVHPPADVDEPVRDALARLHEWWRLSQREAADVLVEQVLDDTGLLFSAAGEPLGDARAGALLHLVEAIRGGSTNGGAGIVDAMERIEALLGQEAPDARLRPGRTDAVRVMNLHKAKGLEAPIVILAAPREKYTPEPSVHVRRTDAGAAHGWMCVTTRTGEHQKGLLAQAAGWAEHAEVERRFADAERDRLLYVAATRAKRELIVAECHKTLKEGPKPVESVWSALDPALRAQATLLEVSVTAPPGREPVRQAASALALATEEARARVAAAGVWSYTVATVTESSRGDADGARRPVRGGGRGAAWGRAVHRAVEGMARGRSGDGLDRFVRAVARDERLDEASAEELRLLLSDLRRSEAWAALTGHGAPLLEVGVMQATEGGDRVEITEGVVDAVVRAGEGWHVLDWKTDDVTDEAWAARREKYEVQVERYAHMLATLSGVPATARIERVRAGGSGTSR